MGYRRRFSTDIIHTGDANQVPQFPRHGRQDQLLPGMFRSCLFDDDVFVPDFVEQRLHEARILRGVQTDSFHEYRNRDLFTGSYGIYEMGRNIPTSGNTVFHSYQRDSDIYITLVI